MAEYIEREIAEKEIFIKQDQERQHWMEHLDQQKGQKNYSSSETAIDNWLRGYGEAVENILAIFDKLSVYVEPVKHGHWKHVAGMNSKCSECDRYFPVSEFDKRPFDVNYCPNCGAKMDGESDD